MEKRPAMPPMADKLPPTQNRGGGPPKPPPDRYYYRTLTGDYVFRYQFSEMKTIMNSKTLTSDLWKLGQECKRLKKAIGKTWPFKQIGNYLQ